MSGKIYTLVRTGFEGLHVGRKAGPRKASSVFAELRMFHTADPQLNMNRAVNAAGFVGEAKEAAARYKAAVLAHPDLSKRLTGLFGLPQPEMWNGHVPPRIDSDGRYNSSPFRAALIPIVVEALDRLGDYRSYDEERLAPVPASAIREPWKESREVVRAKAQTSRLDAMLGEEEGD